MIPKFLLTAYSFGKLSQNAPQDVELSLMKVTFQEDETTISTDVDPSLVMDHHPPRDQQSRDRTNWILLIISVLVFFITWGLKIYLTEPEYIRSEWSDLEDPSRNPLIEYVRIRSRRIGYNLSEAEQFCTRDTRLDNCQLNWTKITREWSQNRLVSMDSVRIPEQGLYCIDKQMENTCFDTRFSIRTHDGNHQMHVWTEKMHLSDSTYQMETRHTVDYYPALILAQSPVEFILVMDQQDYCNLNLLDNECLHYDY